MSFLDSLSVNLTNAGKIVSQKAKNTTESTSLTNKQRKERRNIQNSYTEIGKLYYELHKDAPDPEFAELVNSILASEEQIEALQSQIDAVRLREPDLVTEAPASAPGRSTAPCKPSAMVCMQCGKSYPTDRSFCPNCGIQLAAQYATPAQAAAAPAQTAGSPAAPESEKPVSAEAKPVSKRFCPYCGNACADQHSFCPECGQKL